MNSLYTTMLVWPLLVASIAPPTSPALDPNWPTDFAEPWPQLRDMVVGRADLGECDHNTPTGRPPHHDAEPIPRTIHQVWFGDPAIFDDARAQSWQAVAQTFGYSYHLWTEEDDQAIAATFGSDMLAYIDELRRLNRYDAASDVLRYCLLEHFGGMYFDIDVPAPTRRGVLLDPALLWPMEGLVLVSEHDTREVNNSAFYAINAVMMSAPHHPVMTALVDSLLINRAHQADPIRRYSAGPTFLTGQGLVTATVRGTTTFIPGGYLEGLGMSFWPEVLPYREALRKQFQTRAYQPSRKASVHIEAGH